MNTIKKPISSRMMCPRFKTEDRPGTALESASASFGDGAETLMLMAMKLPKPMAKVNEDLDQQQQLLMASSSSARPQYCLFVSTLLSIVVMIRKLS